MEDNIHKHHRQRMKQRFDADGGSGFADHELLEFLLFYSVPRGNTNHLAHQLLNDYGSLSAVFSADPHELMRRKGIGEHSARLLSLMSEIVKRFNNERLSKRRKLENTDQAGEFAVFLLGHEILEYFYVISMDIARNIIHYSVVSEGTVNEAYIYIRKVMEEAIKCRASAVIFAHNHPGGGLMPSMNDLNATMEMTKALNMIGIEVDDHIIVSGSSYFSMRAKGLIKNYVDRDEITNVKEENIYE